MRTSWLRIAVVVWMITGLGAWITCERASGQFCDSTPLFLALCLQAATWIIPAMAIGLQLRESALATTVPPQTALRDASVVGLFFGALCGALSMLCAGCSMLY